MKYFNIKSICLGIGIGIILTATTGMLYFNSVNYKEPMTKEEIINAAKAFGMIDASSVISQAVEKVVSTPVTNKNEVVQPVEPVSTPTPTPILTPSPTPTLGPEVIITVHAGDTAVMVAKELYDKKLIKDQNSFVKLMVDSNLTEKMFANQYSFRIGFGEHDIINALTTR